MTTMTESTAGRLAAEVAEVFDGILATVDAWRVLLEQRLADASTATAEQLDPFVETFAVPAVTAGGLITGAGFVCAPGLLSDAAWHLAWWLAAPPNGARRLATVDDPASDQFRDYTALEWWRVPERTRQRHLTGPYVDYVCTDDYTVTITMPVTSGGRLLGMVGIDALVDRLDGELRHLLRAGGAETAVVNASARVVTATQSHLEPGSLLRMDGLREALAPLRDDAAGTVDLTLPGGAHVLSCGGTSLALVIGL